MIKLILRYGLMSGILLSAFMVWSFSNMQSNSSHGMQSVVIGFASMIVSLGVFMVLANLKHEKMTGAFRFKDSVTLNLGIAVLVSVMYLISWALVNHYIYPEFVEDYKAALGKQLHEKQLTEKGYREAMEMMANYPRPLYFIMYTLVEILPLALVLALVMSTVLYFLRRRKTV